MNRKLAIHRQSIILVSSMLSSSKRALTINGRRGGNNVVDVVANIEEDSSLVKKFKSQGGTKQDIPTYVLSALNLSHGTKYKFNDVKYYSRIIAFD